MNIIDEKYGRRDVFEVVEKYPAGYIVWPIGRHNFQHPGYIPLAKTVGGGFNIDRNSLKAIKVDEEVANAILQEAIRRGVDKEKFERMTAM